MIDLNKIDTKCNAYLNSVGRSCSTILDVNEIKELVAYARQAEKDAARYRWLADRASTFEHGGFEYQFPNVCAIRYMDGAQLNQDMSVDEAVDEAMQCQQ